MWWIFIAVGIFAGIASGMFGIGGGVIVVPALVLLVGFSQETAVGTSLAALLAPAGIAAVLQYHQQGKVNLAAVLWIALGIFLGAWLGAILALRAGESRMRLAFGVFMIVLGIWLTVSAVRGIGVRNL
ncbi:MAG TPA: sulfite exporter TauE/SafE family protein [bacterium]|jgi:uncharacterized membrane protein YfcA|nr:sulfite exporter TauE/SafE family protein [bacterium]